MIHDSHLLIRRVVVGSFLAWSAQAEEPAAVPTTIAPATTEQIHQTVDRATPYLRAESAAWLSSRGCAACHHVPMPLWGAQ